MINNSPIKQKLRLMENYAPVNIKTGGGGQDDSISIIKYLKNARYIEARYNEQEMTSWRASKRTDKPYIYKIITGTDDLTDDDKTNFMQINKYHASTNSYYFANGYYSTAVIIKCISGEKYINKFLIIKYMLIKNNEKSIREWNKDPWNIYKIFKKIFNNFITNIYFYGDDVINYATAETFDKEILEYDENKKKNKKRVAFTISEYCSQEFNKIDPDILIEMVKKLVAVMVYFEYTKYYISDFKLANISFDKNHNWVCIDFDNNLFAKTYEKKTKKYIYHYPINITSDCPCYLMTKFFDIIKDDMNYIENGKNIFNKLTEDVKLNNIYNQNIRLDNVISRFIESNDGSELIIQNNHKHYTSNLDLGFDKINSGSLAKILTDMFFKKFYYENDDGVKTLGDIRHFIRKKAIFKKKINKDGSETYIPFILNAHQEKYVNLSKLSKIIYRKNICDEQLLKHLFYGFLEPLKEEYIDYCEYIKLIIYDKQSKTGLLSPQYDNIPTFSMVFEYLSHYKNRSVFSSSNLFDECILLIKENLDINNIIMDNIFENTISYDEWRNERKIINDCHTIKVNYV